MRRIPTWLKVSYTAWLALWIPCYWSWHGPQNFLWFCDIGHLLLCAALWKESRLIFSWQAVSLLIIQLGWTIDFASRLLVGDSLLGGTEYMFDSALSIWTRVFSLFHVLILVLVAWAVLRLGYDRRALPLQCITAWVVLPVSFLFGPEMNLNYVWAPFGVRQALLPPAGYMLACMALYPLVFYLPTHFLLKRFTPAVPALQR